MTAAMRRTMKRSSWEFDPRKFLQAAMDETKKVCIERFEAFGCAGRRPIYVRLILKSWTNVTGPALCANSCIEPRHN